MATMPAFNTRFQPIYNRIKETTPMNKDLTSIIDKVRHLQELTRTTGFHTTRSIGALLADLTPDELVEVNKALTLNPNKR